MCNIFDIICLCVCLSICRHSPGQTDRHTDLYFMHVGQVEEYLSQAHRSRSLVKGQGHEAKKHFNGMSLGELTQ